MSYYRTLDPKRRPQQGDVLYTVVGSYGIPVLIKSDDIFCVQRHIAILRPSPEIDADRKSTRLNSSHPSISYAVFCLKKKISSLLKPRRAQEHALRRPTLPTRSRAAPSR